MKTASGALVVLVVLSITGCKSQEEKAQEVKAQVSHTVITAKMISTATKLKRTLATDPAPCFTIDELVDAKIVQLKDRTDSWGSPFKVQCNEDEVTVSSPGKDHQEGTPDDLNGASTPADIERVSKLLTPP